MIWNTQYRNCPGYLYTTGEKIPCLGDETSKQGIKVKAYFEPGHATEFSKDELYKSEGNCDDCLTCGDDCKCNNHQQWTLNLGDAFDPDRLDIYFNNEERVPKENILTVEISNYRNPPSNLILT